MQIYEDEPLIPELTDINAAASFAELNWTLHLAKQCTICFWI